jgi:hypothetical protein
MKIAVFWDVMPCMMVDVTPLMQCGSPLGTAANIWPLYQPQIIDDDDADDCRAIGAIQICRGNHCTC